MAKKSKTALIRNYILDYPKATAQQIADKFGVVRQTVYVIRSQMKKDNINLEAARTPAWKTVHVSTSSNSLETPTVTPVPAPTVTFDNVNHPAHYKVGGLDTIDFIEAKNLGYNLGNVVKYIARAAHKGNASEDLAKARWYLNREISKLQEANR